MCQMKMLPVLVELVKLLSWQERHNNPWADDNNQEPGPLRSLGLVVSVLWNMCDPTDNKNRELLGKLVVN